MVFLHSLRLGRSSLFVISHLLSSLDLFGHSVGVNRQSLLLVNFSVTFLDERCNKTSSCSLTSIAFSTLRLHIYPHSVDLRGAKSNIYFDSIPKEDNSFVRSNSVDVHTNQSDRTAGENGENLPSSPSQRGWTSVSKVKYTLICLWHLILLCPAFRSIVPIRMNVVITLKVIHSTRSIEKPQSKYFRHLDGSSRFEST